MTVFSPGEMKRRMDAIVRGLGERGLDACFLHTADNVYYATGVPLLSEWGRPMWAIFRADGSSAICGAMIEKENMERNSATDEVIAYGDDENVTVLALRHSCEVLGRKPRASRVGVELELLPVGLHRQLKEHLGGAELVDVSDLFTELRLIKSQEELDLLELGGVVARLGADAFLEALHENVTELSVAAHAVDVMNRALGGLTGNAATSTYAYAQFGDHTLTPHLHPTARRLRRGDLVALNVFPVIWGYCTELERTFVYGKPAGETAKVLAAVNEAFDAGKEAIGPGVKARDIDKLTRDILSRHGYLDYVRHGTGHAHGIMIGSAGREEPGELRIYNDRVLEPGMANSVEPGVYLPELGGFRHSDVMFITGDGARCVTNFSREIAYGA